jgi:hypothetical protein
MTELTASRTLVKSPPELWAECSDAASLARHLGEFGEIRITKLEPETAVAWEGESMSGTVRLEPAGWGTRVTLTARCSEATVEPEAATEPEAAAEPESPEPVGEPAERRGLFRRLMARLKQERGDIVTPVPTPAPEPPPDPVPPAASQPRAAVDPEPALTAALDSLGQAHHRPFSRA